MLIYQIFTADEPEVEALPRKEVTDFLAEQNEDACIAYLEHLVHSLGEEGAEFHDRLAELYMTKAQKDQAVLTKLLDLLDTSHHYRANRLLAKLKTTGELAVLKQISSDLTTDYQTCLG